MSEKKEEMNENLSDDYLHKPDEREKWRESYYFNWIDSENKISGFTTLGIVPNEHKREFVFILFRDNKRDVYYREPELTEYIQNHIDEMLSDKKLSYQIIKPLEEWKIKYNSRKYTFELTFSNRHPIYYFGKDSSASWHRHFESSGIITGTLTQKNGRKIELNGYGQRDKSWGYRDWHEFEKWYAGHFQFKDWASGFRKDYRKNGVEVSGYIWNGNETIPLKEVEVSPKYGNDAFNSPIITEYTLIDENSKKYNVLAKRISNNSFMRFAREFEDGYTELFEQMVIIEDKTSGNVGTGMSEELRTQLS
ncbi:MAG: hypothetical protein GF311_17605 [Candidatus Lokiarchaeota archaeon]|jgi:hypothetical protein|nr:hypothetical protein [Candidatus Lokiarchaeota archaeon]